MDIRSVKNKISFGVGACVLATALVIIWYSVSILRESSKREASAMSLNVGRHIGAELESRLNRELRVTFTLAQELSAVKTEGSRLHLDRNMVEDLLRIVLDNNPKLAGIYTCWEPDAFEGAAAGNETESPAGADRFSLYLNRSGNGQIDILPLLTQPGRAKEEQPGPWYTEPKNTGKVYLSDPFSGTMGSEHNSIVTMTVPILAKGKFYGVVGIDLQVEYIQQIVDSLAKELERGKVSVITANGILVAVSDNPGLSGQHMKELHPDFEEDLPEIRSGKEISTVMDSQLETFVPVQFTNNQTPWSANILVPMAEFTAKTNSALWKMTLIGIFCVGLALFLLRSITTGVLGPLAQVADLGASLAEGDLTRRLNMDREDEIGVLAAALDNSCTSLSKMIREITTNAEMQASASQEMSSVSAQLAATSEEMNAQAESVAGATEEMSVSINAMASASEEMSVNIQSVSSTAEQMSTNMNSIASSVEQMSTSIEDVALNAKDGSVIAKQAMEMSGSATKIMDVLGKAAKEIGEVTSLIKRIADQTNLLALNATIEAASAGDAGKGFAVVANEIKELANQSGQAASEIAKRVKGVQGNASSAVEAIINITDIIRRMNDSSTVISKSVEEQTSTALEISDSVQQATAGITNIATSIAELARGANDVSKSASEAARGVTEVSANIQGLSRAASESNSGAQQVNQTAAELARISNQLREVAGRFKVTAT